MQKKDPLPGSGTWICGDGGDSVLIDHLRNTAWTFEQNAEGVKGFNDPHQFDAIHKKNVYFGTLGAQSVQKWVLSGPRCFVRCHVKFLIVVVLMWIGDALQCRTGSEYQYFPDCQMGRGLLLA